MEKRGSKRKGERRTVQREKLLLCGVVHGKWCCVVKVGGTLLLCGGYEQRLLLCERAGEKGKRLDARGWSEHSTE